MIDLTQAQLNVGEATAIIVEEYLTSQEENKVLRSCLETCLVYTRKLEEERNELKAQLHMKWARTYVQQAKAENGVNSGLSG
jgi:hypothetical protein